MSIVSDIFGVAGQISDSKARAQALDLQKQEYLIQNGLASRQANLADALARQGMATRVDASGNTTAYDANTNTWRTVLTPEQKQIQDQSDAEQLKQLGVDATAARDQRAQQAGIRSTQGATAQALQSRINAQIAGQGNIDPSRIASAERLDRTRAVSGAIDGLQSQLGTQALRSGASGGAAIAQALAKARASTIAGAVGTPSIDGLTTAAGLNGQALGQNAQLYGDFASRAANSDNVAFAPSGTSTQATADQAGAAQGGLNASSGSALALANAARGLAAAPQPNFVGLSQAGTYAGLGKSFDAISSDLASAFGGGSGGGAGSDIGSFLTNILGNRSTGNSGSSISGNWSQGTW